MANDLETRTDNYSPMVYDNESIENLSDQRGLEYVVKKPQMNVCMDPNLKMFTEGIKDKKRRKEIEKEISDLYTKYVHDIKKGNPVVGRAELLEQAYHIAGQEPPEGKEPIHVLNQKLYSNPGRQYQYVNGIVGDKKKSKDIRYEIGRAGKYAIKEGWPVLGAGAAWLLANNFYKKNIIDDIKKAGKKKGILKGALKAKKFRPGKAIINGGLQAGKYAFRGTTRPIWNLVKTPAAYAIGAYATYKVIKYLLKRRKEKKLENQEVERLENIRNEMLAQKQMFYTPRQEMEQEA